MKQTDAPSQPGRRQFLSAVLPACLLCCPASVRGQSENKSESETGKHKFQKSWGHTYEEAFRWRYGYYMDIMEGFSRYLGREKLIDMIKRAVDESTMAHARNDPDFSFTRWLEGGGIYANMMSKRIVEKNDRAYEMHVTECLWAETFRKRNAADLGYATVCYGDFADARASHPKLILKRTRTIMEGHGFCNHRWEWNG